MSDSYWKLACEEISDDACETLDKLSRIKENFYTCAKCVEHFWKMRDPKIAGPDDTPEQTRSKIERLTAHIGVVYTTGIFVYLCKDFNVPYPDQAIFNFVSEKCKTEWKTLVYETIMDNFKNFPPEWETAAQKRMDHVLTNYGRKYYDEDPPIQPINIRPVLLRQ